MDRKDQLARWHRAFIESSHFKDRLSRTDGDVLARLAEYQESLNAELEDARAVLCGDFNNGVCPSQFNELVDAELAKARSLHPKKLNSHHEAYAVAQEEVDECWDAVKSPSPLQMNILGEIVQAAAMFRMWAEDLGLVRCG